LCRGGVGWESSTACPYRRVYTYGMSIDTTSPSAGVGLRQLRENLSAYVAEVRAGRTYTVTEHGRPIMRLAPLEGRSRYDELVATGVIQMARTHPAGIDPPVRAAGTASDLVRDQRR